MNWFMDLVRGKPHHIVFKGDGEPYLKRWYIIPRNRLLNVYLHKILTSDDVTPHDHPWHSVSFLLAGDLKERRWPNPKILFWWRNETEIRRFRPVFRKADTTHRLILPTTRPAWTLLITGPRLRKWGFWRCIVFSRAEWIPHDEYER